MPAGCDCFPTTRASVRCASWATGAWSGHSATWLISNEPLRRRHLPMNGEELVRKDLGALRGSHVLAVNAIPEGHSGFTYFVAADRGDYVLRIPPPGTRIAGPAEVVRQGRIMSALHDAGLPVPAIRMMSSDPVIDGRPFILMERVDGARIEPTAQRQEPIKIATSAIDVLQRLQALPLDKTGIGDEDQVTLQVEMMRWAMLMQRAPEELTTRAGELGGLLAA